MKKISEPVVFFGSGPVAAASLELLAADFEIETVITKPRPPHHRGDYPVLDVTQRLGLKTLLTGDGHELDQLFQSRPVSSRLGIVIDYGIIIGQAVIDYFPLGIINSHFSLLPRWRGADPISFAILNGDQQTGVSLMLINNKLDEGPLLAQSPFDLLPDTTTPQLTEQLISLSHQSLNSIVPLYAAGKTRAAPQSQVTMAKPPEPTYSRKLTKEDSLLDFAKPAAQLEREVRAYAGWPRSRTMLGEISIVVTKAHVEAGQGAPGQLRYQPKSLGIYTSKDTFVIDSLIPAGKKEMPASAFLAGYTI